MQLVVRPHLTTVQQPQVLQAQVLEVTPVAAAPAQVGHKLHSLKLERRPPTAGMCKAWQSKFVLVSRCNPPRDSLRFRREAVEKHSDVRVRLRSCGVPYPIAPLIFTPKAGLCASAKYYFASLDSALPHFPPSQRQM